jgi:hypothetical protein
MENPQGKEREWIVPESRNKVAIQQIITGFFIPGFFIPGFFIPGFRPTGRSA